MANSNNYRWQSMKCMPSKRVFSSPIEVDKKIYVIGGCDDTGNPMDLCEMYDTQSCVWSKRGTSTGLPGMPTKRAGAAIVTHDKKIYVIGGVNTKQESVDAFEVFDTQTKKWTQLEPMKDRLLGVTAVVHDGKILVIGGMGLDTNPRDYLMCFNIEKNVWQALEPMPTPRYATGTFKIGDKLYVVGGRQGKTPVTALEVYDLNEKKWTKLKDIPSKRVFPMYTVSDKNLFSIGGLNANPKDRFSNTCEVYDFEKDEWKVGKPMPTHRGDGAIGFIGGRVVIAGGLGNAGVPLQVVEAYNVDDDTWSELPDVPSTHCSCAHLMYEKRLYVIGGLSKLGASGCMETLSVSGH